MIMVIEQGSGVHTIDFQDYEVKERTAFFLAPGQAHKWILSPDTTGYQVLFSSSFLLPSNQNFPFFNISAIPALMLGPSDYDQLFNELESLQQESVLKKAFYKEQLKNRLLIILTLLKRAYWNAFKDTEYVGNNRIIQNYLLLLEKYYHTNSEVAFYADKLHVTANYLNQVCRKKWGTTASNLIKERILLEAKRSIALTNMDIKEVAFSLGFTDISYFSRFFKKQTGLSPLEFRNRNK